MCSSECGCKLIVTPQQYTWLQRAIESGIKRISRVNGEERIVFNNGMRLMHDGIVNPELVAEARRRGDVGV